jgi:anthranilate synthase component 1
MTIHPSQEAFAQLSAQGNVVPVWADLLADLETPVSAYAKLRGAGPAFLLESVEGGEHVSRYSFIGCNPREIFRAQPGEADPLATLQQELAKYRPVAVPGLPPFTGGAVGYLGYEYIHCIEKSVPLAVHDELGMPMMWFMLCDSILAFDRAHQTMRLIVNAHIPSTGSTGSPQAGSGQAADAGAAYDAACAELKRMQAALARPTPLTSSTLGGPSVGQVPVGNFPRAVFEKMVEDSKEFIRAGDIFQIVLSQRFTREFTRTPLDLYRALRTVNPSPYMFLLETGEFALVGASPEVHVRLTGRKAEIRPIAGTRPRGQTSAEDAALEKELLADDKERAEHLMLVDLARNDIGRVCSFGSIKVPEFMTIERYSHVMHIVSQVEGQLAPERTAFDLMRATFPAGTVSGAPKIRAMQLIAEKEGTQRGSYAGALGYFSYNGNLDSCITLRTALIKDGKVHIQAGAGIVADSVPAAEYQETINKASALFKAISLAEKLTS